MTQQQQNDSKTPAKGGTGNVSQQPDRANEITRKTGDDAQARRDAHSNSSTAGKDRDPTAQKAGTSKDADADGMRGGQHSSTKNLETEPDRANEADRDGERSRTGK